MKKKLICCLCGKECENEYGNNPYPVIKRTNVRCCNACNDQFVIPARIHAITYEKRKEASAK